MPVWGEEMEGIDNERQKGRRIRKGKEWDWKRGPFYGHEKEKICISLHEWAARTVSSSPLT